MGKKRIFSRRELVETYGRDIIPKDKLENPLCDGDLVIRVDTYGKSLVFARLVGFYEDGTPLIVSAGRSRPTAAKPENLVSLTHIAENGASSLEGDVSGYMYQRYRSLL